MGAMVRITRTDYTSAELRALSVKCTDGAQVRRLLAVALVIASVNVVEKVWLSEAVI